VVVREGGRLLTRTHDCGPDVEYAGARYLGGIVSSCVGLNEAAQGRSSAGVSKEPVEGTPLSRANASSVRMHGMVSARVERNSSAQTASCAEILSQTDGQESTASSPL
jgi:hypothetical protein